MTTKITPTGAIAISGILNNQGLEIPGNLTVANTVFSTTQLSGASQTRLISANADIVWSLTANVPGFITGIVPLSLQANIPAGVSFNSNNLIATIHETAAMLLGNNVTRFTEIISIATDYAKDNYDLAGALQGLSKQTSFDFGYSTIAGQITGGVAEQFGNAVIGSQSWIDFTANLANLGSYFNPKNLPNSFQPHNVVSNLIDQGQITNLEPAFVRANLAIANYNNLTEAQLITVLDQHLSTETVQDILDVCQAKFVDSDPSAKFSNTLVLDNYLSNSAQQVVDTGSNLAMRLYNIAGVNSKFTRFQEWGQLLSQITIAGNVDLINSCFMDPVAYNQALTITGASLGSGHSVFGTPDLNDIIGPAADKFNSTSSYSSIIDSLCSLQANLLLTAQGQNLLTAIVSGNANVIAETGDIVTSSSGTIGNIVLQGNKLFQNLFNQIVQVKQNLARSEITDQTGNINPDITGTANTVRNFITNSSDYFTSDRDYQLGYAGIISAMSSSNVAGQSILASQAENRNSEILKSAAVIKQNSVAFDTVTYGAALVAVQPAIQAAGNLSVAANLSYTISTVSTISYSTSNELPEIVSVLYVPGTELYLSDSRLLFNNIQGQDFLVIEFELADTVSRSWWFRLSGDLTVDNFSDPVIQTTSANNSRRYQLAFRVNSTVPPILSNIITCRVELFLTQSDQSRPIWSSSPIQIVPFGFQVVTESGI